MSDTWVTDYTGDIGNTFALEGAFDGLQPAGFVIEVTEIVVHEADEPNVVADLLDADLLAGKHGT